MSFHLMGMSSVKSALARSKQGVTLMAELQQPQGSPLDATHIIALVPATPEARGAFQLKDIDNVLLPFDVRGPTLACPVCGAAIPVPGGNLLDYAQQRARELGSDSIYVKLQFGHRYNTPQPPGTSRALASQQLGGRKNIQLPKKLTPEQERHGLPRKNDQET
jgi:hypothetical protein